MIYTAQVFFFFSFFFSHIWETGAGPTLQWAFIRLSKCYYHCDRLSSYRHRLLNLLEMRCKTQRWRGVGPALIGQAGGEKNLSMELAVQTMENAVVWLTIQNTVRAGKLRLFKCKN
jgi:hypothetical protein